jgi:hypothetical protein
VSDERGSSSTHRLAVVGGGPRATYALERISAAIDTIHPRESLEVRVFERSGQFGAGEAHSPQQPVTSYLNRTTEQVSFAADESMPSPGPLRPAAERPTLYEWCQQRFSATGNSDLDLGPADWPKRYVHGMALREMFARYRADLTAHAGTEVHLHEAEVTDIERLDGQFVVRTADAEEFAADQVLVVTGHTPHDPGRSARGRTFTEFAVRTGCGYIPNAYPLQETVTGPAVDPGRTVGIQGMGLTAIDVILHLTEGRGGSFEAGPQGTFSYRPSGREPARIVAFSKSGLFTFARPANHKGTGSVLSEHRGVFLTFPGIDCLRENVGQRGSGGRAKRQLDFERDVLPVVILEMALIYYRTLFGPALSDSMERSAAASYDSFLHGGREHSARQDDPTRLLPSLEAGIAAAGLSLAAQDRFDWQRTVSPIDPAAVKTADDYRRAVLDFMAADQDSAVRGNLADPDKAATDGVWRDLRSVISYAVDDGGLTPESHRVFAEHYTRIHNRLVNGAGVEVMARIRALIGHGLLDVGVGPEAVVTADEGARRFQITGAVAGGVECDTLVEARVHPFSPELDGSPLFRNMLRSGTVRLWRNTSAAGSEYVPGGIDLTDSFHPIRADGMADEQTTILGPPGEGKRSFLLSALRPCVNHYVMQEISLWAAGFWRIIEDQSMKAKGTHGNEP